MRISVPAMLAILLLGGLVGLATAQDFDAPPPSGEPSADTAVRRRPPVRSTSFASLIDDRKGHRLLVEYPWSRHREASIEIRLVTGEQPSVEGIRPMAFVAKHFHGDVRMQIYNVQDAGAGGVVIRNLEVDSEKFEVLGGMTPLGNPATCVVRNYIPAEPPTGAYAIYCQLRPWALSDRLLSIELPKRYFADPGKMKIWFLRGREILWEQTLDWPGVK